MSQKGRIEAINMTSTTGDNGYYQIVYGSNTTSAGTQTPTWAPQRLVYATSNTTATTTIPAPKRATPEQIASANEWWARWEAEQRRQRRIDAVTKAIEEMPKWAKK